jgi:hypothetical protein
LIQHFDCCGYYYYGCHGDDGIDKTRGKKQEEEQDDVDDYDYCCCTMAAAVVIGAAVGFDNTDGDDSNDADAAEDVMKSIRSARFHGCCSHLNLYWPHFQQQQPSIQVSPWVKRICGEWKNEQKKVEVSKGLGMVRRLRL